MNTIKMASAQSHNPVPNQRAAPTMDPRQYGYPNSDAFDILRMVEMVEVRKNPHGFSSNH